MSQGDSKDKFSQDFWWASLGGPLTSLLVRGYGLILCLAFFGMLRRRSLDEFMDRFPPAFVVLSLCGFALLFLGPRLITLLLTSLASGAFLHVVLMGEGGPSLTQQAAEYPFFVFAPAGLLALAFAARFDARQRQEDPILDPWESVNQRFEDSAVCFFRITVLITLFTVSFHKINWDFFDPTVSCEGIIKNFYAREWDFEWYPRLTSASSPLMVVLLEGPVPILLLLFFRRVGILATTGIYTTIMFCNAIVITLMVIIPSLAFLTRDDLAAIKRHRLAMGSVALLLCAIFLPHSYASYHGTRLWFEYATHHVVVAAVAAFVGGCLVAGLFQRGDSPPGTRCCARLAARLRFTPARLLPAFPAGKAVCLVLAAAFLLKGFSPYLGLKFNYSFAMLSNLRTDEARWNHMLVPEWVRLTRHDPYIRVHHARFSLSEPDRERIGRSPVREGMMYSAQAFHDQLETLSRAGDEVRLDLVLEYRGREIRFQGRPAGPNYSAFLEALPPPSGHWFYDMLPMKGPQPCKH